MRNRERPGRDDDQTRDSPKLSRDVLSPVDRFVWSALLWQSSTGA